MEVLRKDIIKNLTAFQFYGILIGVRTTDEGLVEFNEIETHTINLLMRYSEWGRNPVAGEVLNMANRLRNLREKYQKMFKYEQHSSDEILIQVFRKNFDEFFSKGIILFELNKVVELTNFLKYGHFFQNYMMTDRSQNQVRCAVAEFLENAQYFYNEAWKYYNEKKKIEKPNSDDFLKTPELERSRFHSESEITVRFFKEAFINLILFVESFINAVGYDAFLQGIYSSDEEKLNLQGQYTNNKQIKFLSIKNKLKTIPKIINKNLGNELDPNSEPYKTYFENFVDLRNSYMHTSPSKGSTWFSPLDWMSKNDILIDNNCFQVIEGFWKACYPNKSFPLYLKVIYYSDGFVGRQKKYFPHPA